MDKSKLLRILNIKVFDLIQIKEDGYNAKCTRVYALKNESEGEVPIANDFTEWFSTDSYNHRIIEEEFQRDQILPTYKESFRIRADWQPLKKILRPKEEYRVKIIWDWSNFVKDRDVYPHLEVPYDPVGELRHYSLRIDPLSNKFFSFKDKNIIIAPPPSNKYAIDNNNLIIQREVSGNKGKFNLTLLPKELNKIPYWVILLAKGQCPKELLKFNKKPDELLEFYLYRLFLDLLSLDCRAWGQIDCRFESFSDGFFCLPRKRNFISLYDAKAYSKGYNISKEILKLANYVVEHKADIEHYLRSEIKYFIVVSSEFRGDTKRQAKKFYEKSGVKLVLCRAEDLVYFTNEVRKNSETSGFLKTVRWEEILSGSDPFFSKEIFTDELKRLERAPQKFSFRDGMK